MDEKPIFYDPTLRRWRFFIGSIATIAVVASTLLGVVYASISDTLEIHQPELVAAKIVVAQPIDVQPFVSVAPPAPPRQPTVLQVQRIEQIAFSSAVHVSAPKPVVPPPVPRPRPDFNDEKLAPNRTQGARIANSPSFVVLGPAHSASSTIRIQSDSIVHLAPLKKHDTSNTSVVENVLNALGAFLVPAVNAQEFKSTRPSVYAHHVNWDDASLASYHEHVRKIDVLVPHWLNLSGPAGEFAADDGAITQEILALRQQESPGQAIIPLLTNYALGQWQAAWARSLFTDDEVAQTFITSLVQYLEAHDLQGVALNFLGLTLEDQLSYQDFLARLSSAFATRDLKIHQIAAADYNALDPTAFSHLVDAIVVQAYGETGLGDLPAPLVSPQWFEATMARWQAVIPPEKLVFTLANMAYDWSATGSAQEVSVLTAFQRARTASATIALEPESLTNSFAYTDQTGGRRTVHILDGVSAYNQFQYLTKRPISGVALYRLGTEDPTIWHVLTEPRDSAREAIETIDYSYQLAHIGDGELIRVTAEPISGQRSVTFSPDGAQIIASRLETYPRSYEIEHWNSVDPSLITLTFDDGPHPVYTPQILDVLAKYNVKATFFAVGVQMLRHPDIVRRIVDEGHEIGSHTYSHTNISNLSEDMLRLDLNATQRVFQSITGRNMWMFRAPYATDMNAKTPAQIAPLVTVGSLGYLTVNMNIDPTDWWLPQTDTIVRKAIDGVDSGAGHVILLHDSGGSGRDKTVAALPQIIETLQGKGYRFSTVSELIGLTPDNVMPVSPTEQTLWSHLESAGYTLMREGEKIILFLFTLAISLGIARSILSVLLSWLRRPHRRLPAVQSKLRVGVIVPAYNEETVVLNTVRSLLKSNYTNFEILVVDDGSKDATFEICRQAYIDEPRVRVITKPNGGKSSALNHALDILDVDVVIALDADTIFLPDTISRLASHFHDPKIAAVAGNAKVGNRVNLLTRWQAIEYITSQNLDRRAFDFLNCITVVPGAVGAWRYDVIKELGGYSTDTLAEDADLTIKILRAGHRVTYEEGAIALTEAPEKTRPLLKQRFRWMFGMLQVTKKHYKTLALKDSKSFALVGMPNILFFQMLFPLVAPFADLVAIGVLVDVGIKLATGSNLGGMSESLAFLAFFSAFILLDLLAAAIAFWNERDEDWWLLLWVIPSRVYYRQLLYIVAIKSLIAAIRGTMVGWGKLDRSASALSTTKVLS
jgi:cellulose synthase/poly-beta-1,6-N-acetylglucosamine synthase-like glycosyltransferase/peptidoglycan/xylan/chitin deacetylase (PgdA/CDA1 family)/spore germination protein YaaH